MYALICLILDPIINPLRNWNKFFFSFVIAIKSSIAPAKCIKGDQQIFYSDYQLQLHFRLA